MGRQETLTQQIAEERQAVQARLKRIAHRTMNGVSGVQESPSDGFGDILDTAQLRVLKQQEVRAYELLVSRARGLDRAWETLRRGSYGICQMCRAQIPRRRLEAVPDAAFCLSCQEKVEQAAQDISTR
ncbi:MAG: TraR/DksA family transcriptional regulator [Candidatus Methylomirabilales bacterium]